MKLLRITSCAVLLWLLATGTGSAQAVGGSQVSGVVRDSSGGVLPGAEVTITKTDTGTVRTVFTNADGSYTLPNLPVGPYQLKVVLQGFNTYVRDGIVLQVSSNPTIDVTLSVGALDETVNVVANASMVETRSTAVGQLINNEQVIEMPLNGRQATELIFLSGLATPAPSGDLNTNKNYPTVTISVAGGQANGMTYIMDGGTYNDPFNNLNLPTPNPDALQEFKVESSALPARYGHHAASAVNIVTKSGSNTIRGNAFEFLRDYHFNSRNAFALERDSLKRHQFGGTVGGPITRDKIFFFGSYQGTIEKTAPTERIVFVPSQAMLNGDFTTFASAACQSRGNVTLRAPFVGNRVDPALFNQSAVSILKKVPVATDPCGRYQYGVPDDSTDQQVLGKIDYTISQSQTLTGRYMYARYHNPVDADGSNILEITRTGRKNQVHGVVVGHNWILSTNAVNSLHVTYNQTINDRTLPSYFAPKDVGIAVDGPIPGFMGLSISGAFSVGAGGTNPGYFHSKTFAVADDFDWIKGKHQLSFGLSLIKTKIDTSNNRPTNGAFSFNGSNTGLALADFLLGRMSSFMQGNAVIDYWRHLYFGAYVQDDWKPTSNLTFNYGVRWEPFMPVENTFGFANAFSREWFDANRHSAVYPQAPAGLMFPGDEGYPDNTGFYRPRWGQVAPRLGVIWSPLTDNSMSVRAAYGIFYDTPHLFFGTRYSNSPPWGAQISLTNPAGGLSNPWSTYPGGNPFPALRTEWASSVFPFYGVYVSAPLDLQNTRLQQWNASVQKGFGDLLFAASYLGNKGTHAWRANEQNPAIYRAGATTGNTNQRRVLYQANQAQGQYYSTIGTIDDTGRSEYHGLLLSAQKRMSNNWSILSNYTLSKCMSDPVTTEITGATTMNPWDPDLDYSYCSSDRRHVWNLSLVARVPTYTNGLLGALISDWQIAPIIRVQSGNRSSVTTGTDVALTGTGNQRAVQVLDDPYGDGTAQNYLNPAAFDRPTTGTYSTDKPYLIVNPGRFQNDIAISRTFRFGGARVLQFRWEIFNLLNRVNLNGPSTALNSSTFGQITGAGDPRIMQLGFKFTF
ncbi:MAG: carboxypeptidase regulatory-like domain-containing protein [Acidobacteriota bacterium]